MSRLVSIVFAAVLASTAAHANVDGAIPEAVFPTLPTRAQSASDLVPSGWTVEKDIRGDLNADGVPDVTLLLRGSDPANVIEADGAEGGRLDTNPRLLVVAFADGSTESLSLVLADHGLIPRHTEPRMEDPLHDVSVVRGTLQVSLGVWMSSGGWSTSNAKLTFRHRDGCFRLIGHDATEVQRNSGKLSELSVNYLTGKAQRRWGYTDDDVMNEIWETFEPRELVCLAEVGDGLEFAPDLGPRPDRAAEMLEAAAETAPAWSAEIDSLQVGSPDGSATFEDVRSTCSESQLRRALDPTATELRDCLAGATNVRLTVAFADGRVATRVEPDDEGSYCVSQALDRAHFDDLVCIFEASLSSP